MRIPSNHCPRTLGRYRIPENLVRAVGGTRVRQTAPSRESIPCPAGSPKRILHQWSWSRCSPEAPSFERYGRCLGIAYRPARSAGVLPHPARSDELWRSGSPTSCIPRVEPAPTNESSFQMTHMCFSHTTAASPKPNGPARCARSRRGSNAGGRLQSSLLPIDAHRRLSTNGSGPSRVNRPLSGEQPVTHRFPRVSVEDVVQRA